MEELLRQLLVPEIQKFSASQSIRKFRKLPFNDLEVLENEFKTNNDIAGVIVEGIQRVGSSDSNYTDFYRKFNNCVMKTMPFSSQTKFNLVSEEAVNFSLIKTLVLLLILFQWQRNGKWFSCCGILISPKFKFLTVCLDNF